MSESIQSMVESKWMCKAVWLDQPYVFYPQSCPVSMYLSGHMITTPPVEKTDKTGSGQISIGDPTKQEVSPGPWCQEDLQE